jgi:uncharacterized damage-inducible protein DinB
MATASARGAADAIITHDQLLEHWQGHRRLTRRVIEAFPDEHLFAYSIGGMRSFGVMALEMLAMAVPTLKGVITDEWTSTDDRSPRSRNEVLAQWDAATEEIDSLWPQIPPGRFQEAVNAFGQWPGPVYEVLLYVIDNEIHHRGQGFVYLRALGIEPPFFYER